MFTLLAVVTDREQNYSGSDNFTDTFKEFLVTPFFKVGDKVTLQGARTPMTVEAITGKNFESAVCSLNVGHVTRTEEFKLSQLVYDTSTLNDVNSNKFSRFEDGLDPKDISVQISELLVATSDDTDALIPASVQEVLKLIRQKLNMDVVFVSEFVDGKRVVRQVECRDEHPPMVAGQADPLESTWCQRIVDGRLPLIMNNAPKLAETLSIPATELKIGSHLATPIVLSNGKIYGTFCCFSARTDETLVERDLKNLQMAARFAAEKLEKLSD